MFTCLTCPCNDETSLGIFPCRDFKQRCNGSAYMSPLKGLKSEPILVMEEPRYVKEKSRANLDR